METFIFLFLYCLMVYDLLEANPVPECKRTGLGADYMGMLSQTQSGVTCQSWDSQIPHEHNFTDPSQFPDASMEEVANHCRNPNERLTGPWCYTTDPDLEWESCDVPRCSAFPECKMSESGTEYRGIISVTESGLECMGLCRNPDEKPGGPWCNTVDPDVEWEYCDIPFCKPSANCRNTESGENYIGTVSWTRTGRKCQRWDRQAPHDHEDTDPEDFPDETLEDAGNFCRNPDGDINGPWCYTIDPEVRAEYCPVSLCQDCKNSATGREYAGSLSQTLSGIECQRWDTQSPHPHDLTDPNRFPDASLAEAVNYCRNPDSQEGGPWCYTQDPDVEWDYCDIPDCEGSTSTDSQRVPIARHIVHIGIDGLHPGCMGDAPGGLPNILGRLGAEGTSTRTMARTTLVTVSAPGWSAHLCGMSLEASGITGNGWLPPWQGHIQSITPISGNDVPLPCVFQTIKAQDVNVQTGHFFYWNWLRYIGNTGDSGIVNKEYRCYGTAVLCDPFVTSNLTDYLADGIRSSDRSYTFIHLDNVDGMGHTFGWCGGLYLQGVALADSQVGQILDAIEEAGLEDEVMVFLSSDHGGHDTSHGSMQDSDLIIPMFVKGPGIRQGASFEHEVRNGDIVPTALYAMGLEVSPWMNGHVMWEAFEDVEDSNQG